LNNFLKNLDALRIITVYCHELHLLLYFHLPSFLLKISFRDYNKQIFYMSIHSCMKMLRQVVIILTSNFKRPIRTEDRIRSKVCLLRNFCLRVTLKYVFLSALGLFPVRCIPQMVDTHSFINKQDYTCVVSVNESVVK